MNHTHTHTREFLTRKLNIIERISQPQTCVLSFRPAVSIFHTYAILRTAHDVYYCSNVLCLPCVPVVVLFAARLNNRENRSNTYAALGAYAAAAARRSRRTRFISFRKTKYLTSERAIKSKFQYVRSGRRRPCRTRACAGEYSTHYIYIYIFITCLRADTSDLYKTESIEFRCWIFVRTLRRYRRTAKNPYPFFVIERKYTNRTKLRKRKRNGNRNDITCVRRRVFVSLERCDLYY